VRWWDFALLQAADVSFGYARGAPVLDGVSVDVPEDGVVGVIGPNGSGKTTLLRLLAGVRTPRAGRVTLDGTPLDALPRRTLARRMAVVPQETHLAFDYPAIEVVLMGRYPHLGPFEIEGPRDYAAATAALAATGVLDLAHRPFETLSGGEKQRVIIAAALAQIDGAADGPASILLLDEPTSALDLGYQLEVAALLRDLRQRRRLSLVISTHDLNFAASLCTALVLIRAGRVLAAGATADVLTPDRIRQLYGVDADVHLHPGTGHLVVVPVRRASAAPHP
jgi:iron complex transport system ATP-binding protein